MSTTEQNVATATQAAETRPMSLKLEVVVVPVSDAERAKQFYASLGWREDADFVLSEEHRILQFTPPGSQASIIFGAGVTSAAPGSGGSLLLAVDDVEAARAELIERGVEVSDVFHGVAFKADDALRVPGPDPERGSYKSFATFRDPDGNEYLLQEVSARQPGRTEPAALAELLHETALHHDRFEKAAQPHDWWDWYAAYLDAREHGSTSDQADDIADRFMKETYGVVVSG